MSLVASCSKCKREFIQKEGEDEEDFYHSIEEHISEEHREEKSEKEIKEMAKEKWP